MGLRVLLVDDNQNFLTSVRRGLQTLAQVEVVGEAHDAAQALRLSQRLQPDVLLLDWVLPGGPGGFEVARSLHAQQPAPQIIFLSMHDNPSYQARALELGAVAWVAKANFVTELLPLLTRLAARTPLEHQS